MLQRFGLDNLLAEQKGKRENNIVFHKVRRKIKIPQDVRDRVIIKLPNGQFMTDDAALRAEEDITIQLESEEVRKLRKLGDEAELPAAALDWLEPIMEQLEAPSSAAATN